MRKSNGEIDWVWVLIIFVFLIYAALALLPVVLPALAAVALWAAADQVAGGFGNRVRVVALLAAAAAAAGVEWAHPWGIATVTQFQINWLTRTPWSYVAHNRLYGLFRYWPGQEMPWGPIVGTAVWAAWPRLRSWWFHGPYRDDTFAPDRTVPPSPLSPGAMSRFQRQAGRRR